jgi:hypothetical protein
VIELGYAIQQLQAQKQRIQRAIALREELHRNQGSSSAAALKRRGRKSMGSEERREMSERMKRYWASRRRQVSQELNQPLGSPARSAPDPDALR